MHVPNSVSKPVHVWHLTFQSPWLRFILW